NPTPVLQKHHKNTNGTSNEVPFFLLKVTNSKTACQFAMFCAKNANTCGKKCQTLLAKQPCQSWRKFVAKFV
ncbi:MAG: hypothetical protein IJD18_03125, partial [Clostridia bacterium]|nr:hypothetical protein [Clostridia bacterium]